MATASKAAQAAAKGTLKTYEVISPLQHDLESYAPGDPIELTDAQAAPLLGHTVKPAAEKPAT